MKFIFRVRKTELGIARISFYTDAGAVPNKLILTHDEWDYFKDLLECGFSHYYFDDKNLELEIEES